MRTASPEKRKFLRDELIATPSEQLYDFDTIKKNHFEILKKFKAGFNRYGIFCTTLRHDSLLMWAHYAQSHQGAVLQFAPDFKRDSVLCASKPVLYAKERPLPYSSRSDLLRHCITMSPEESTKRMLDKLIFTKSLEWEYEQEFRLVIPNFIPVDASFRTLNLVL